MPAAPTDIGDGQASARTPLFGARRRWAFALIGLLAYLIALVATLPARFVIAGDTHWAVAGTVWNGEAVRDGAYRLEWRWAPWRSLAAFAFAADIRLSGGGTDLAGAATKRGDRLLIEGLSGRADGAALTAFVPGLPFACDATFAIDVPRFAIDGPRSAAIGELRADAVNCAVTGASDSTALPPLLLRALRVGDATLFTLAPVGRGRLVLVEGRIANGRLAIATTRAGGVMMPFARGFRIDRPL